MRVLIAGDWHGNTTAMRRALFYAQKNDCQAVVQCGDYGMGWSFHSDEVSNGRALGLQADGLADRFTEKVAKAADVYDMPVWWIDGNHENFDFMEAIGIYDQEVPVEVAPKVWYMPRGYVKTIEGKRILFIGGAHSVDKPYRIPFASWWPQEEITAAQVERCLNQDKVDIVISHDMPNSSFVAAMRLAEGGNLEDTDHLEWKNDQRFPMARPNRMALEAILEHHRPELWIHGHYHSYYEVDLTTGTHVVGLNLEDQPGSCVILHENGLTVF